MERIISIVIIAIAAVMPAFCREITGMVVGENGTPLDFVNVVLYRDSTYVTGTVTGNDGRFSVSTDVAGDLAAKVSFVGYEARLMTVPASGDMGTISLVPSAVELGEVTVHASRPSTVMKGNALVTNVEGSSLAMAGTAMMCLCEYLWWSTTEARLRFSAKDLRQYTSTGAR